MLDKILFIDTETGGLDPLKHSLLSIGLVIWENFRITNYKEIFVFEKGLKVDSQALEINKININEHKKLAQKPENAVQEIKRFLSENFSENEKITLAGHNINFDVNFLRFFLDRNNENFSQYFSHRFIDTSSILYFLYLSGKLKAKAITSTKAFELFGINIEEKYRHTALGDALATAKLFNFLINVISKKSNIKEQPNKQIDLFTQPSLDFC